jgi:hypothetical protein
VPLRLRPVEVFWLIYGSLGKTLSIIQRTAVAMARCSNCCAVSRRCRNASKLFRKDAFRVLLRPWAGKECLTPPGRRGAMEGRAVEESLERAPSCRDAHPTTPPLACLLGRHGSGLLGKSRPQTTNGPCDEGRGSQAQTMSKVPRQRATAASAGGSTDSVNSSVLYLQCATRSRSMRPSSWQRRPRCNECVSRVEWSIPSTGDTQSKRPSASLAHPARPQHKVR